MRDLRLEDVQDDLRLRQEPQFHSRNADSRIDVQRRPSRLVATATVLREESLPRYVDHTDKRHRDLSPVGVTAHGVVEMSAFSSWGRISGEWASRNLKPSGVPFKAWSRWA